MVVKGKVGSIPVQIYCLSLHIKSIEIACGISDINSNTNADVLITIELGKVIEWLKINKLSLSKNKSKYMLFHMPKKEIQNLTLKIDDVNIEMVEEFYF